MTFVEGAKGSHFYMQNRRRLAKSVCAGSLLRVLRVARGAPHEAQNHICLSDLHGNHRIAFLIPRRCDQHASAYSSHHARAERGMHVVVQCKKSERHTRGTVFFLYARR